jgi:hypothetical protein
MCSITVQAISHMITLQFKAWGLKYLYITDSQELCNHLISIVGPVVLRNFSRRPSTCCLTPEHSKEQTLGRERVGPPVVYCHSVMQLCLLYTVVTLSTLGNARRKEIRTT